MKTLVTLMSILLALQNAAFASTPEAKFIPDPKTAKSCTVIFRRDVLGMVNSNLPLDVRTAEVNGIHMTITSTFVSSDSDWLVLRDYRIPRDVILFVSGC